MYYIQLSILQGDWISAIGSLVGALIGGLIAYFIALSQVKQMKNEKKVEEIKKFYNVYFVLNPLLEKLKILLNEPSTEKERYPLDFPKDTLINHMMAHLSKESDAKSLDSMKEKKESLEMSYHHLHQIIKIKEELLDVNDTIVNLRSGHIPLEFYKTYQDIIYTLKRLIYLTEKFLFHDDDVSKSEFEIKLNSYHERHSNNKVIQSRITKTNEYSECVGNLYDYKNKLENLFEIKEIELKKLEK